MTNETSLTWRKSSRSYSNGQCVEVAEAGHAVLLRDSKNPAGPRLRFEQPEWRQFVAKAKAG